MAGKKKKRARRKGPNYGRATPPKHLRTEHDEDFEINGIRFIRDGRAAMFETTPGFDQDAFRAALQARAAEAAGRSAEIVDELRHLVRRVNALHLVGQVATWMTIGDARVEDAEARFGLEAQAEFLTAVAVQSGHPTGELAGPGDVQHALALLTELFEAERERILGEQAEVSHESGPVDEVRFWVRQEALSDRTQGYVPHLAAVVRAIFEPIRQDCVAVVGFCPADIPLLIEVYAAERQRRFDELADQAFKMPFDDGDQVPSMFSRMAWVVFTLNDPWGDIDPPNLAGKAGLPAPHVAALLDAMATPWDEPIADLRPGEAFAVRRRPALRGSEGKYAWPLAWASLHEALPWFADIATSHPTLEALYRKARATAAEGLVAERLAKVFGEDLVHVNFEYPIGSGNWAECDTVVRLPAHALAIEVKSGALDDLYRGGDADYAASTYKTLVDEPFRQSARAADFLKTGGPWRTRGTKEKNTWVAVPEVTRIAVSLERIDALALAASRMNRAAGTAEATWVLCLSDLLMVAEVLDNPYVFLAYARVRAALAANPVVAVISEADLLGAFLHDRLRQLRQSVSNADGPTLASLNHHAQDLNAYYSALAAGGPTPRRPALRLKHRVRKELDALWATADPAWAQSAIRLIVPGDRRPAPHGSKAPRT